MPTKDFKQFSATALALPGRQRAKLAQALWNSIESEAENAPVDRKTLAEIRRRDREITEGKVRCKSHAEVMKAAYKAIGCSK